MANDDMEFKVDVLREIFSRLPLKCVVQCKLLTQSIKRMISHSDFAQTLFQRHKDNSTQLIYTVYDGAARKRFNKISLNPITQSVSTLPDEIEILASCNGLILIDFEGVRRYYVFNPMTGEHQLIPYPKSSTIDLEKIRLAVDYSKSDQYKLVTVSSLVENSNLLYKFHLLSSERPGLWREIQLTTNTVQSLVVCSRPVYWRDSLYCLRKDGSVLAFDTKREEAILIDRPEFLDSYELSYGKILSGQSIWLGRAQVIATYGSASRRWRVSHNLGNFILGSEGIINGFPVWIDNKLLHGVKFPMYCFHPTLAGAHYTPSNNIEADDQAHIAAKLDDIRRFIIEGIPFQEESSSRELSSSSSEEEEAAAAAGGGGGGGGEDAAAGEGGEEEIL
ncbi:hypothetical protein R3W88_009305 [Solanum pinnatisectum]|uniref:F-box associated beta-propeller type 1 domain-containing protein n=1 Tax=Solanum pinnatisectum TaxID=50273 RepID=A0AAV9MD37_9SOLN|nr:hypothetical protein R3W88_009305 [Solanum pinnatisectum]